MKKTRIIYWASTIIFVGLMAFSAIPDVLSSKEAVAFMTQLGYPQYFIPFIGVVKLLGCIALLVPGFPRIKEWAYAGFAYDLIGAIYSALAAFGFDVRMTFILVWVGFGTLSYIYFHKMMRNNSSEL